MSLYVFYMLCKIIIRLNSLQVAAVTHGDGKEEDVRDEVGGRYWTFGINSQNINMDENGPLADPCCLAHSEASSLVALIRVSSLKSMRSELM